MIRSDPEIEIVIVLSDGSRASREIFLSAIELPNTQVAIDVDAELTIVGIAREDAEIYRAYVQYILNGVYHYEILIHQDGVGD